MQNKAKEESSAMPGMLPTAEFNDEISANYTVKYFRGDLDEVPDVLELQRIETVGLKGDEIILCDRQTYSFEGRFFVVLRYYQKKL